MNDTTTLKKAVLMIQKLKKQLQQQNKQSFEPIAIIGMSCRLPQANNIQEFWELLYQGNNVITPITTKRWEILQETNEWVQRDPSLPYWGGYLNSIEEFDAYFFGISPREALRMDPQQRILLEVAHESLEDAGIPLDGLAGTAMGVFSSLYASQFSHLQTLDSDLDALFLPTGSAISMAANRLSYLFDLRGPSMVLDTACSSSLIALHLACINLQLKYCDTALVNAININLLPSIHSVLAKATMLSPTGQCHTFDAKADGYVQGEGAGSIILKPLSKALKDKDRIHGVITGSAVNQDGKTNGLTAPNGLQQEQLLRTAYQIAQTDPALVSYIECHGTGTLLGDPIEIQALGEVIGTKRETQNPCWISSVKTNIGHLEPAAGIISLIKAVLVLKNKIIPPHLNCTALNPHLQLEKYSLKIPTKIEKLPQYGDIRIAGVSGFGFGGANAHIVLRELLPAEQPADSSLSIKKSELFTISTKDSFALSNLIRLWCDYLQKNPETDLAQLCYNLHLRRSHFAVRLAIITHSIDDLHQKLFNVQMNKDYADKEVFIHQESKKNPIKINEFDTINLATLAEHYINNAAIDWHHFEVDRFYTHLNMPLYPWQHKKYWPALNKLQKEKIELSYPMRGKTLSSPLSAQQFEFVFDTQEMPEIQDAFYVLHAGYYLEMLAFAMKQLQKKSFMVRLLNFLSPIIVLDEKTICVHLILDPDFSFRFYSNDGSDQWIEHASGRLDQNTSFTDSLIEKANFLKQKVQSHSAETFYQRITDMGMPAGDSIRWIKEYWADGKELWGQVRDSKKAERSELFFTKMHPGIIDACIQTLFLLLPKQFNKPYIASHIEEIEFYDPSSEPTYIYTKINQWHSEEKEITGDWYLLDKKYQVIAKCINLCMTPLNDRMQINQIMKIQSQFRLDLSLPFNECKKQLIHYLAEQIALLFSMPINDIDPYRSLNEIGMDSLMALAVIRIIETNLKVTYSIPMMMKGPSVDEIAEYVLSGQWTGSQKEQLDTIWIANRKIQVHPQVRLFCFPYGGGGASIYREWQQEFPDFIEVCPIQLPGRENRLEENPLEHFDTLISLLAHHLTPHFDLPFAFFGHSFGSLIGFELARYLRLHHLSQPIHLFASAYPDPRTPSKSLENLLIKLNQKDINLFALNQEHISQLGEDQLNNLSLIFKENGIVDYSDERMNVSIIKVLLPIFIGDMRLVTSYIYRDESPLKLPTTVFIGQQDTWVSPEDHLGWADHSLHCEFQYFDSGHLFIRDKEIRVKIIQKIAEQLKEFA